MRLTTRSLIGAWVAASLVAWAFRESVILLAHGDALPATTRAAFAYYSTLDMFGRILHGAVFFLIVDAVRLERIFGRTETADLQAKGPGS